VGVVLGGGGAAVPAPVEVLLRTLDLVPVAVRVDVRVDVAVLLDVAVPVAVGVAEGVEESEGQMESADPRPQPKLVDVGRGWYPSVHRPHTSTTPATVSVVQERALRRARNPGWRTQPTEQEAWQPANNHNTRRSDQSVCLP
jgi:hypothetical protein